MITDRDIKDQVTRALGLDAESFDIGGITDDVLSTFGLVDIDGIPDGKFWEIVAEHDRGE